MGAATAALEHRRTMPFVPLESGFCMGTHKTQPNGCIIADMDDVFKALADASRRQLLDQLHQRNGQTLGELCEPLAMSRQAVAKHLAILEAANLVSVHWQGREKLHYLNPVPLHEIHVRWIGKFEQAQLAALHTLKTRLEESTDD
ncbi:ArsR family transcriptional regulator [Chitiniphilus purpureus]|uniref:ArsR family transcriptional regulator n=1 Tax=Chitiniphilus purpureus TaxID=2981137 RepID=A0ABY6DL53_9NEIS|nr:helix-turn-helix transcriptional regulator [Chitiniphilus sp. CD1]UXY15085.1 ArsR family transcriptional regulator [Chitiniphilus sp. CD1]